jgi:hypothetical protein
MSRCRTLTVVAAAATLLGGCLWAPAAGAVTESATLQASFTPDQLGAGTTIGFGFHIATAEGGAPPPLTDIKLHMPAGMDYTATTLGLAICQPEALLAKGLTGCPNNSRLGSGSAFVEVPFGTGSGHELPEVQALMGPPTPNSNIDVLFYANGQTPVYAQLVFKGELLPSVGRFGSELNTAIPPIQSVPNGPDVSIISVEATIGPNHLTYYKHVHGRRVPFHPIGIAVPVQCPSGGFPFGAEFNFQDGSSTTAATTVPCPPPVHHHHHHK